MLKAVRKVSTQEKEIYLTFDDGPNPKVTPALLELLENYESQASFFVIGEKAHRYRQLTLLIQDRGHAIGDHSWDHKFRYFFRSDKVLKNWIQQSQKRLTEILGEPPIGFRSPAGVITPPLKRVLKELQLPLIHWNRRCFDSVWGFTPRKAEKIAARLQPGDVILLHDGSGPNPELFLSATKRLLELGKEKGFEFKSLKKIF